MQLPSPTILLDAQNAPPNTTAFAAASQRSSGSMALHDPIATHLLVETALGDSKGFEILSFEELDALKKEDTMLISRVAGVRHRLTLETKVRDAARSMNRLYGPGSVRRGSGPGPASPRAETVQRAGMELAASERKCDELGRELYYLEGRSRQTQTRLLRHTAAILQNTYGTGHRSPVDELGLPGGRPYSPDSLDADRELDAFDDGFFLDEAQKSGNNSVELQKEISGHLKDVTEFAYAVLRQTNPGNTMANLAIPVEPEGLEATIFEHLGFLGHCLDEMEEERHAMTLSSQVPNTSRQAASDYQQMEARMTTMLTELNKILAGTLTISAPQDRLPPTPSASSGSEGQLKYAKELTERITTSCKELIEGAPLPRGQGKTAQYEAVVQALWQDMISIEAKTREQNDTDQPRSTSPPFSLAAFTTRVRWLVAHSATTQTTHTRLRTRLRTVQDSAVSRSVDAAADAADLSADLADARSRCAELEQEAAQRSAAHGVTQRDLDGLGARLERAERAATERATGAQRDAVGLREKLERVQAEHANARREADGLRAKMDAAEAEREAHLRDAEGLRAEHAAARDDAEDLRERLQDAEAAHGATRRDLEGLRAEAERASAAHERARREAEGTRAELERANAAHERTRREADGARERLNSVAAAHATAQRDATSAAQGTSARLEAALAQARRDEREAGERAAGAERERARLEQEVERMRGKLEGEVERVRGELEREVERVSGDLERERARRERAVREAEEEAAVMVDGAQGRVRELEAQVADLRAAAAANEKRLGAGIAGAAAVAGGALGAAAGGAGASARERALREELESTLREFEELTRAGVEAEREREELERTVDRLRDSVEGLEARLSEERIGKLGGSKGSPGADGAPPAGSTSTMVLRNEFKKMMKDARADHQKALKSEMEERRRLESMVRTLKREQSARGKPAAKPGP